jgi:hypothetical protein
MLWHHLLHPPEHPQFRRIIRTAIFARSNTSWIAALAGPWFCLGSLVLLNQLRLSSSLILLAGIITFSSLYAVTWAVSISAAIIREHEHRTYDQLCLAPSGALGVNWAICAGVLHRDDALGWIDFLRKLMAALLLFILLAVLLTTALRQNTFDLFQFLALLLDMLTLAAMSYIDHVQSIVLGSLVGMLMPVYLRNNIDVRISTIVVFLASQAVTFLAAVLVWNVEIRLLSVAVAYLLRESLIILVWRTLVYHLNAEPFFVSS